MPGRASPAAALVIAMFAFSLLAFAPIPATAAGFGVASAYPTIACVPPKPNCSYNWAGYDAYGSAGSVTMVNGSWIQPALKKGFCKGVTSPEYALFAVGIDTGDDTVQIGSAAACTGTGSKPANFLWFEVWDIFLCPGGCVFNIIGTVSPGDTVAAWITQSNCAVFNLTVKDLTTGFNFNATTTIPTGDGQSCSQAEWLTEAAVNIAQPPTMVYPLADYTTAKYGLVYTGVSTTCYATIGGVTGPIGSFSPSIGQYDLKKDLALGNPNAAKPGPLTAMSSFTTKWS